VSTDQHPIHASAPLPDDPMETTAEQYANHHTATYWFVRGLSRELIVSTSAAHPGIDEAVSRQESAYAITHLTDALRTFAPEVADNVIRELLTRQSTIVSAEMAIGRYAERAGIDIDALQDAGKQAAKNTP